MHTGVPLLILHVALWAGGMGVSKEAWRDRRK